MYTHFRKPDNFQVNGTHNNLPVDISNGFSKTINNLIIIRIFLTNMY